jgi:LmbE family N-acetylglucosaminyl deacetylase
LILAPHPDDEILGCAGIVQRALKLKLPVRIIFFTYGDSCEKSFIVNRKRFVLSSRESEKMGMMRHDEAAAGAKILGLPAENMIFLGYPDFGTLKIWETHWDDELPYRSILTKVTAVPYDNALRPGAPYKGEAILQDLKKALHDFKPTKIFVSHSDDYHPDHRALYLFTAVALWDLEKEMKPEIYPYLIHYTKWPQIYSYHPDNSLQPPNVLEEQIPWQIFHLTPKEEELKMAALKAHKTQYAYSAKFLTSFIRTDEFFGNYPVFLLHSDGHSISSSLDIKKKPIEIQEESINKERVAFISFEKHLVQIKDGCLIFSIEFSQPLANGVEASIYIFGYRSDRDFGKMPKLHIKFGEFGHSIYDKNRKIPQGSIQVMHRSKQIKICIPLSVLGNPQRILTSARTYLEKIPLDHVSWRILELSLQGNGLFK